MARVLTKRGLAQIEAGNKTVEECLASNEFSVEQTPDMKVRTITLPSLVEGEGAPPAAETKETDEAASELTVADLSAQLAAANTSLQEATEKLTSLTDASAKLQADLDQANAALAAAQAEVAALKPVAVTGVRSLQIKLGRATNATSAMSVKELTDQHTELSAQVVKAFPTAPVSVADNVDQRETKKVAAPPEHVVSAFSMKKNRGK